MSEPSLPRYDGNLPDSVVEWQLREAEKAKWQANLAAKDAEIARLRAWLVGIQRDPYLFLVVNHCTEALRGDPAPETGAR